MERAQKGACGSEGHTPWQAFSALCWFLWPLEQGQLMLVTSTPTSPGPPGSARNVWSGINRHLAQAGARVPGEPTLL